MLKSSGRVIGIHLLRIVLKSKPTFHNFIPLLTGKKTLIQDQIIQYIKGRHLFGLIECDIHIPEHLKDYFSEMTPIFKNTEVSLKDVGQHMLEYAKQHDIKDVPHHLLIGPYFGKKIGLATPLLKWYLEH